MRVSCFWFRSVPPSGSIVIRGDQSLPLRELRSSRRADPFISIIGFAPQKVVRDGKFFWIGSAGLREDTAVMTVA
jgi:hypothetical protein